MKLSYSFRMIGSIIVASFFVLSSGQNASAGINEGVKAYKRGDYAAALKEFRPLAEKGNAKAQSNLGLMYSNGHSVSRDYKEALKWYRKSANQGHAIAQHNLGVMYD